MKKLISSESFAEKHPVYFSGRIELCLYQFMMKIPFLQLSCSLKILLNGGTTNFSQQCWEFWRILINLVKLLRSPNDLIGEVSAIFYICVCAFVSYSSILIFQSIGNNLFLIVIKVLSNSFSSGTEQIQSVL